MATTNPFYLLGDNDNDDPSQFIVDQRQKLDAKKPAAKASTAPAAAKLPTKPVPPAQALRESREARSDTAPARGGAGRGGPGRGRADGRVPSRDFGNETPNEFSRGYGGGGGGGEDRNTDKPDRERPPRQPFSGGRRGGYAGRGSYRNDESGGESERPPRRLYERRSGTGRGYEVKRQGAGRGNWGTVADETLEQEKDDALKSDDKLPTERQQEQENAPSTEESKDKEGTANEAEEKEEDMEMTLEEYEKVKDEKRKALLAMKAEERKVEIDKELQSMQLLTTKRENDPFLVKLGSDKDGKKKENIDRDDRSKKPLNINELFKTSEGKQYYSPGGRGRGRGRGNRVPSRDNVDGGGSSFAAVAAPSIEDPSEFPTLGGK